MTVIDLGVDEAKMVERSLESVPELDEDVVDDALGDAAEVRDATGAVFNAVLILIIPTIALGSKSLDV